MSKAQERGNLLQLAFCAAGIYGFFLTWGLLQERIATMEYRSIAAGELETGKFRFFQVLNLVQAMMASLFALLQLKLQNLPLIGSAQHPHSLTVQLLSSFFRIALCSSLGSSLGYRSLRHLNYPTLILGKSCKLVPVMLMNVLIYRKRFEAYKYVTVALITAGVFGFMFFEGGNEQGKGNGSGNGSSAVSLLGIGMLLSNLLLDGATNSWQDQLFLKYRLKSQQLMMFMNAFSGVLLASSLVLGCIDFSNLAWNRESQLMQAVGFVCKFPSCLFDLVAFAFCGAMGQLFIFYTLEHFGSLVLVTITVTRKLFTILLSLFWFSHPVNVRQWGSVALVFAALILEAGWKYLAAGGEQKRRMKGKTGDSDAKEAIPVRPIDDEGKFLRVNGSPRDSDTESSSLTPLLNPGKLKRKPKGRV
jgi:UDP-galactose transporter B1